MAAQYREANESQQEEINDLMRVPRIPMLSFVDRPERRGRAQPMRSHGMADVLLLTAERNR